MSRDQEDHWIVELDVANKWMTRKLPKPNQRYRLASPEIICHFRANNRKIVNVKMKGTNPSYL